MLAIVVNAVTRTRGTATNSDRAVRDKSKPARNCLHVNAYKTKLRMSSSTCSPCTRQVGCKHRSVSPRCLRTFHSSFGSGSTSQHSVVSCVLRLVEHEARPSRAGLLRADAECIHLLTLYQPSTEYYNVVQVCTDLGFACTHAHTHMHPILLLRMRAVLCNHAFFEIPGKAGLLTTLRFHCC